MPRLKLIEINFGALQQLRKSDYADVTLENKGLTETESGAEQARMTGNKPQKTPSVVSIK